MCETSVCEERVCLCPESYSQRVVSPPDNDHRSLALAALVCPPAVFLLSESEENALDMLLDKDLKNLLK
jgi:hypothetical protein